MLLFLGKNIVLVNSSYSKRIGKNKSSILMLILFTFYKLINKISYVKIPVLQLPFQYFQLEKLIN
jgi:hypothetical protein